MDRATTDAINKLTEIFRKLGVPEPESWARGEVIDGIPQLAPYVFVRQAWSSVISEEDDGWIDRLLDAIKGPPDGPLVGGARAVARMLAKGVARQDVIDLVRCVQYQILFYLCYQLSDPGVVDFLDETMRPINWRLYVLDENGRPIKPIECLHELVIGLDPTGREMRPRGDG